MKRKTGFTLIELLIVVAIIAILAAIAVPNFLEAQVRSKVARSVADMRSLATALEAYAVDYNKYPMVPQWPNGGWENPKTWLLPLTTPISYITTLPSYPWLPWKMNWGTPYEVNYYYYNDRNSFEVPGGYLPWNIWDRTDTSKWYVSATGPDGDMDQDWTAEPGSNNNPYDPTNGTVSSGDIIRIGP